MTYALKASDQFQSDVRSILNYVSSEDASAARRVLTQLRHKLALLELRPLAFRLRPELGTDIRCVRVFSYLIAYRVDGTDVLLERMVHASRELEALFDPNE